MIISKYSVTGKRPVKRWNRHKQKATCGTCLQNKLLEFAARKLQKASKFACFSNPNGCHPSLFNNPRELTLENLALQQQLAVYKRLHPRPQLRHTDRLYWIWLSKIWNGWRTALVIVQRQTLISWHRQGNSPQRRRASLGIAARLEFSFFRSSVAALAPLWWTVP